MKNFTERSISNGECMERLIKPEFVDPMGSQATDFKDNVSFLKFFDFQCLDPD